MAQRELGAETGATALAGHEDGIVVAYRLVATKISDLILLLILNLFIEGSG